MNHCNYTIYGIPVKCNHPISYLNMQSTSKAGLFLSIQYMKTELQMNQILIHSTQQGYRIQLAHYMDVLIHHDKPIIECQTEKEEYLFSTLFNIPFSVYFTLQNELLLHVSSMECQNRLLCFAGEKGTGKSTLVSALDGKFLQIYSDDTLRVDRHQFGYHDALAAADLVKYVCDHCHRGCFQVRNEWMVDRSARLIAAYTGEKGGTKNTVDYAARKGVQTVFVL